MVMKHDSILAYYECGPLVITLWPNTKTYSFDKPELTIARNLRNVYAKSVELAKLIPALEAESLEKTLELEDSLTKDEIKILEKEKSDLIEYLKAAKNGRLWYSKFSK